MSARLLALLILASPGTPQPRRDSRVLLEAGPWHVRQDVQVDGEWRPVDEVIADTSVDPDVRTDLARMLRVEQRERDSLSACLDSLSPRPEPTREEPVTYRRHERSHVDVELVVDELGRARIEGGPDCFAAFAPRGRMSSRSLRIAHRIDVEMRPPLMAVSTPPGALRDHYPALHACYAARLATDPDLEDEVVVEVVVDGSGGVTASATGQDDELAGCVRDVAARTTSRRDEVARVSFRLVDEAGRYR